MVGKRAVNVAEALGAGRVVRLEPVEHTPLGLLALTDRVRRLKATDPAGRRRRLVVLPVFPGPRVPAHSRPG